MLICGIEAIILMAQAYYVEQVGQAWFSGVQAGCLMHG